MSRTTRKAFVEVPHGLTVTVLRDDYRNFSPLTNLGLKHERRKALRAEARDAIAEQLAEIAEDIAETQRMAAAEWTLAQEDAFWDAIGSDDPDYGEPFACGDPECPFCHPHTDNCRICGRKD